MMVLNCSMGEFTIVLSFHVLLQIVIESILNLVEIEIVLLINIALSIMNIFLLEHLIFF